MADISDDVVVKLLDTVLEADKYAEKVEVIRAAGRVFVEWALEEAAKHLDIMTGDDSSIYKKACGDCAFVIRALKDAKPDGA